MFLLLGLGVSITPVHAQDQARAQTQTSVDLRTGRHDGFSRIVFEWPSSTGYSLSRPEQGRLEITFKKKGNYNFTSFAQAVGPQRAPANILGMRSKNIKKNWPVIEIDVPEDSDIRDFAIGSRIILDVFDPPGGAVDSAFKGEDKTAPPDMASAEQGMAETPPAPSKPESSKPKVAKSETQDQTPADSGKAKTKKQDENTVQEKAAPPKSVSVRALDQTAIEAVARQKEDFPDPPIRYKISGNHTYSITSTRAIYLSVFQSSQDLWIVHNQPDNNVPPKLTGPEKEKFPELESLDIHTDVKVYKLTLPFNAEVYTEGGGLLWRINIVPEKPEKQPDLPKAVFSGQNNKIGTLVWEMPSADFNVLLKDPETKEDYRVIGVGKADDFAGPGRFFIDLETMPSLAGLALRPKIDELEVTIRERKVIVSKKGGLAISRNQDIKKAFADNRNLTSASKENAGEDKEDENRLRKIYEFNRWIMGGPLNLRENENILLADINQKDEVGKIETLLALAKLYLANDKGPEALGYLSYAGDIMPDLKESAEFLALRGSAETLTGQYQDAFEDYAAADLDKYHEIDLWRAMVLAGLGDWGQAGKVLPKDTTLVNSYPTPIRQTVALELAEIALRDGRQDQADDLLAIPKATSEQLDRYQKAALDYLSGEAHRQRGENERAVELWKPLANSLDDLHRVKAGLALTKLLYKMGEISSAEAIDRLEQLRYSWRGDSLETRVYRDLGRFYLENDNYLKGLGILRRGTELTATPTLSAEMTQMMTNAFETLFLTDEINKLSPLEAVSVYEQFQELTPAGKKGDQIVMKLAERLEDVGLLGRATELMNYLIETRLTGVNAAKTALRLAAIQLLDDKADAALNSVKKAQEFLATSLQPNLDITRDVALLKARALSEKGEAKQALETLSRLRRQDEDILRLRADISWQNGQWAEAAQALERLVSQERISIQQKLSERQAALILNWAVALNLAGDRRALVNIKNRFSSAMDQTSRSRLFDVVTRPRQNVRLTDRKTIQSLVSEVDMFSNFLTTYKKNINSQSEEARQESPAQGSDG